jgi:hypothetical protein
MTNLQPILKEVYTRTLNEQLNNETRAVNRIQSSSDGTATQPYGGRYVVFPIHTARNSGIGARNENEALPTAGYQQTNRAQLNLKNQYGTIELSGQTFELATKEYQTFANAVDLEMDRIKDDLSKDRNRQYFGSGNGRIATVVSVSGQNITVDTIQHIQDNEILDAVTTGGTLHGTAALVVTSVDTVNNVVTVTGTTTGIVAGDILIRTGNYGREWTGLGAIIDNASTLYNINPANVRVWKAEVNTQGGTSTALSEATFMRMTDRIYRNGAKPTVILTSLGVQRAYWLLLTQQRRFVDTKTFEGGYRGLEFSAGSTGVIPLIADIDAPASTAMFVNEKAIQLYRPHGFKFMDRDGSMWKQKVDSGGRYDAYVAELYEYSELGTTRRNSHGIITNITEDAS